MIINYFLTIIIIIAVEVHVENAAIQNHMELGTISNENCGYNQYSSIVDLSHQLTQVLLVEHNDNLLLELDTNENILNRNENAQVFQQQDMIPETVTNDVVESETLHACEFELEINIS